MVNPCTEKTMPARNSTLRLVFVPSDSTYSGRNGKILEKPTAVISCAKNMISSVRCQRIERADFMRLYRIIGSEVMHLDYLDRHIRLTAKTQPHESC
jgi:hypothetical protein